MGQALVGAVEELDGALLSGGSERVGHDLVASQSNVFDNAKALADVSDVLIDFTVPQALDSHLNMGRPLVIGTTGLDVSHHAAIDEALSLIHI